MRAPQDFTTTMNGMWSSLLMSAMDYTLNAVWDALNRLGWGPLQWIVSDLEGVVNNVATWITNVIFPGAPGAVDWLTAEPEGLATIARATGDTLVAHQSKIRYIANVLVPQIASLLTNYVDDKFNWVEWEIRFDVNNLTSYIDDMYSRVEAEIRFDVINLTDYVIQTNTQTRQVIENVFQYIENEIRFDVNNLTSYINQNVSTLNSRITSVENTLNLELAAAVAAAAAALAAAVNFITDVFVPGAFVAYTAENTAALAAATDILWPLLAEETDATSASILLTLPTVALRAADVPPELAPWLPGLGEGVVAALTFHGALHQYATAPLFNKLHTFADDIAGLPGIISTVIIGVLAAGAITAPETTATVVADTLAGPLDSLLTGALSLIGLGTI